ncbi:hypothetical protein [Pseudonocardia asaccharolytica]|uniref:hypothetical protein n=1 Tax=Pseudonocardia asaccharolytica TaxID=54010 RepID=UPI00040A32C8|nr:hypothetical protein [Pseudonocardia asaccharolytica]
MLLAPALLAVLAVGGCGGNVTGPLSAVSAKDERAKDERHERCDAATKTVVDGLAAILKRIDTEPPRNARAALSDETGSAIQGLVLDLVDRCEQPLLEPALVNVITGVAGHDSATALGRVFRSKTLDGLCRMTRDAGYQFTAQAGVVCGGR